MPRTSKQSRRPASAIPDRETASAALRKLARRAPVRIPNLEAPLRRAVFLYWGDLASARRTLKLSAPPPNRKRWDRDLVIAEITKLARRGEHLSCSALIKGGRFDLVQAAQKYCGGWVRARELAGKSFQRQQAAISGAWNSARVLEEIKERQRTGVTLANSKIPSALRSASQRVFGSWRAAVEAAGLDYDAICLLRTWTDEELHAWIRGVAEANPEMNLDEFYAYGEQATTCVRRWGTAEAAGRAAGLKDWPQRERSPALPRREVIRALRARAKAGGQLNFVEVRASSGGHHLLNSIYRHFRSLDEAIEAAGLPPQRLVHPIWTRKEVLAHLHDWNRAKLGLRPNDIKLRDSRVYSAIFKVFGSYEAAMRAAKLPSTTRLRTSTNKRSPSA